MTFQIPESLDAYSAAGVGDFRRVAEAEFTGLQASIAGGDRTPETIDRAEALVAFIDAADARLDALAAEDARIAALSGRTVTRQTAEPVVAAAEEATPAAEETTVTETAVTAAAKPTVDDLIANTATDTTVEVSARPQVTYTIVAAADSGFPASSTLPSMKEVTAAFLNRTRSYGRGNAAMTHTFAEIHRTFPENRFIEEGMSDERIYDITAAAVDEKQLPGGSLLEAVTAGIGWCAPSETIYSTCSQITATGMLDIPTVGARRGGIRHNQGIDFSTIFGAGTGFNILTEAQVIADVVKTCVQIPCPPFVDDRLKVAALCLTGDLLQNVGYREFVQTFIEGAIAAQAHNVNRDVIATIVAGSTAVNISTVDPWVSDNSVVSQVMSAAELAVMDIRYRLRLDPNATIEMVYPFWVLAQMRADWIRRNSAVPADMTDAMIMEMFRIRGVRAQFVYDWQDAFSGLTTTGPGSATPLLALPSSPTVNLQFLAFPAGTWLLAQQDVIRLDSVYDSTLLATNKVTQLFVEDGYLPMRMCPLSRVYTVNICPNGSTGVQRAVTCTDVTP